MDGQQFDWIVRSLSAYGARRRVLQLLVMVPLLAFRGDQASGAEGSGAGIGGNRRRHKNRVARRRNNDDREPRKQKRKKCKPESPAQTCAEATCGTVRNNCKKPVDCGQCTCGQECCAGDCCAAGEVCQAGNCCARNCLAAACGSGAPETCGVANCGTCAAGETCIDGACEAVCTPSTCPQECNCLVRPDGTHMCLTSLSGACSGLCRDDSDCCPGSNCGASPGACDGEIVCYVLGEPCD